MASARNRIDIWKANLCDTRLRHLWAKVLCEEEHVRAQGITNETTREQFRSSRAFVRDVLTRYLPGTSAAELRFKRGEHGKPRLSNDERLKFNVAHTGNIGVLCVCYEREVGIDIERRERKVHKLERVMRKSLDEEEIERIVGRSSDEDMVRAHFLRAWTQKEAFVKCTGDGISRGLRSFAVDQRTGLVRDEAKVSPRFRVVDVPVDCHHTASLCYALMAPSPAPQLQLLHW
ncbi:unnamed protein product [Agarophyton chilense]